MTRLLPLIAALMGLAIAPARRAEETLNLGGVEYRIKVAAPGGADEEVPAFSLMEPNQDEPAMVICRRGGKVTRLKDLAGSFAFSPELESGALICPVADLFGEAWRSLQWQAEGDRLSKKAKTIDESVAAVTAYENSRSPHFTEPSTSAKLSRGYLKFLTDPAASPEVLHHICLSVLKLPETIEGSVDDRKGHALARAIAYFFVRCPARAAEEVEQAGKGDRADGLRGLMDALGMGSFEKAPAFSSGPWTVTPFKGVKPPAQEEFAFIERSFVAVAGPTLRTYSFTSQKLATKTQYFLHVCDSGRESLVEAFGERKPTDEALATLVKSLVKDPPPARVDVAPPDPDVPAFGDASGTASVNVDWTSRMAGHSLDLCRPALVATVVATRAVKPPCLLSGLPSGTYIVRLRGPSGRVVRTGTLTLMPGALRDLSLESF